MQYRAIALSLVDGTGGNAVGRQLAERLGFGYLNEGVIAQVARDYGVSESAVSEAERRKGFFDRILDASAFGAMGGVVVDTPSVLFDDSETLLSMVRDAVREAAARGNVVLVAHAACYACADRADVLRVWVTAPWSTRVANVAAEQKVSEKEAEKALRRSDAGRASYLKRVYGVDRESPADYDLVVNTERLSADDAVALVQRLVAPETASS